MTSLFIWISFLLFLSLPSIVYDQNFLPGVQDDEDVKRMLQGSSMVKVIIWNIEKMIAL